MRRRLSLDDYVTGVRAGRRAVLARAITLVESRHPEHAALAQQVLTALLPATGGAVRVGITGPPGVGKSTLLDALGCYLLDRGCRPAVLTIDPSSTLTGGSILGDKTRMANLAADPRAYIRPSPSAATLGGVARRTREALLLCEAAGFDVVLVETVGVGQSEVAVADLVDCFVVLVQPGSGDELQGIKKGVLELADLLVVNKADGDQLPQARAALRDVKAALRYLTHRRRSWKPRAVMASALTKEGLDGVWQQVLDHRQALLSGGELAELRREQARAWMWSLVRERLEQAFHGDPGVGAALPSVLGELDTEQTTPTAAAERLLSAFGLGSPP